VGGDGDDRYYRVGMTSPAWWCVWLHGVGFSMRMR